VFDLSIVDEVQRISSDEAIEATHRLHKEEGITAGISSGAAVAAAVKVAARPENQGKLIVVILLDAGDRYHSSVLFQSIVV
jgi:cysteine synthase